MSEMTISFFDPEENRASVVYGDIFYFAEFLPDSPPGVVEVECDEIMDFDDFKCNYIVLDLEDNVVNCLITKERTVSDKFEVIECTASGNIVTIGTPYTFYTVEINNI